MRLSAALKAQHVFLPPCTFRAVCLFWPSTALRLRPDETLVGLSEREIRWKSLKPGIEMEVLSAQQHQEKQFLQIILQQLHTLIISNKFYIFFYLANLFFIHIFEKSKITTAQLSHWAENVIFPRLLCSPRYFGLYS